MKAMSMTLRYAKTALAGIAAATLIAGCGLVQGDDPETKGTPAAPKSPAAGQIAGPTAPPQLPSAGTAKSDKGLTATVHWFKADGQGYGTLLFTVENTGSGEAVMSSTFRDQEGRTSPIQVGGVQVRDDVQKEIQGTLGDTDNNCVCSKVPPASEYFSLNQGQKLMLTNSFPISDEATTVTVMLPGFPPVPNVQVQRP